MPFARTALTLQYEPFAQAMVAILREDMYGVHTAVVRSPQGDPIDARGLSAHERAAQRALFYEVNSTGAAGAKGGRWMKNPDESLQVTWSAPGYRGNLVQRLLRRGERQRVLSARLASAHLAHFYVPPTGYVFNPAEQSQNLML